jgi:ketosteroid isomerase-like protein
MSEENVEIVRLMWAGLERDAGMPWPPAEPEELDRRLRLDLCDEQIEIRNPPEVPVGSVFHGHDGVRQWGVEIWEVFDGLHNELEELIEAGDGDTVVSVQRTQARMRHTGLEADFLWAVVWTIQDGRVLRAIGYMSREEALEAAGLSE